MSYSKLDICNRALRIIRQTVISSLDDKTKEAEECNFLYPIVKDEVIDMYPWRSARKKVILRSITANDPLGEDFKYKFILPFDSIRVLKVNGNSDFKKSGMYLYCNEPKVKLMYTASIGEECMNVALSKLIAIKLAIELTYSLLGDENLSVMLNNLFEREFLKAKAGDSEEGATREDLLINSYTENKSPSWLSFKY